MANESKAKNEYRKLAEELAEHAKTAGDRVGPINGALTSNSHYFTAYDPANKNDWGREIRVSDHPKDYAPTAFPGMPKSIEQAKKYLSDNAPKAKRGGDIMPLKEGYSKESIGKNVKTEEDAGKPKDQAVAIALNTADEAAKEADKPEKAPAGPKPDSFWTESRRRRMKQNE